MEGDRFVKSGCWDSIHIVEVTESSNKTSATYKLTTTVMLSMNVDKQEVGETNWSGTLTRQVFLKRNFILFSSNLESYGRLKLTHLLMKPRPIISTSAV